MLSSVLLAQKVSREETIPESSVLCNCPTLSQIARYSNILYYRWPSSKESSCQCRRHKRWGFDPWVRKIPWSRKWQPTPIFLPGKFHGQKSLAGYNPWDSKESGTTEHTHCNKSYVNLISLSLSQNIILYKFNAFSILTKHLPCTMAIIFVVWGTRAKPGICFFFFTIS